ncbi:hypothetical protein CDLVIII_4110 [Clostridium sp. DL-VIII]|uniref:hypothetical protein n=1 Tax=Clostridium sp. DL-VIII TaxID=641107 RepID=UPI00023AFA33|nr:hypothetical protein [Clostridium sp. DL-VIII]EHJ00643.1 hypothetical protein CDLVIII_4110 [Clostridium sp. DL-VIII]
MDEEIIIQHIQVLCNENKLLYSNNKIVIAPDFEIEVRINLNRKSIHFQEYIDESGFNSCSINYTINRMYRCYYLDKYKDFSELGNAIEYYIKIVLENYKKAFKS